MLDVSVIIINYNTADLIKPCVESVLKQKGVTFEIIVIDNASHDNSKAMISSLGDHVHPVFNEDNLGFGKANNQAFRVSHGRYLFLLNPDAEFTQPNDLMNLVYFMDEHPDHGLIGTRIIDANEQNTISSWKYYPRQTQTNADFSHLPGVWACVFGGMYLKKSMVLMKIFSCMLRKQIFAFVFEKQVIKLIIMIMSL